MSGLLFKVLDEHVETTSGHVSISTMHLAKGLEIRAVVVMACDNEVIPLQERIETVGDDADLQEVYDTERHLLYVACTRALDLGLSLGGYSAPDAILGGPDRVQLLIRDDDKPQSVWRQQNFGSPLDQGPGADAAAPDDDGIPNLVKYALSLPSGVPAGDRLPKAYFTAGEPERKLGLDIPFHPARIDVVIEVLAADTVAGLWIVIVSISDGVVLTDTGVASMTDVAGGSQVVAVRDLVSSLAIRHRFLSVRVRR